jgi:hypothetical protein
MNDDHEDLRQANSNMALQLVHNMREMQVSRGILTCLIEDEKYRVIVEHVPVEQTKTKLLRTYDHARRYGFLYAMGIYCGTMLSVIWASVGDPRYKQLLATVQSVLLLLLIMGYILVLIALKVACYYQQKRADERTEAVFSPFEKN